MNSTFLAKIMLIIYLGNHLGWKIKNLGMLYILRANKDLVFVDDRFRDIKL